MPELGAFSLIFQSVQVGDLVRDGVRQGPSGFAGLQKGGDIEVGRHR